MRLTTCLLATALSCAVPVAPMAQTLSTPAVSPNRPDQNPTTVRERGRGGPGASVPRARARLAPVTAFTLNSVVVEGSTLPAAALEAAWRPFVGRTLDTQGLAALTDALSAAYAANDIAIYTVAVPDQAFEGGVLRVRALEGHVD